MFTPEQGGATAARRGAGPFHPDPAAGTPRECHGRLQHALDAVVVLARRSSTASVMCKQCAGVRDHLFIFLDHPEVAAANNGSERELRPTGTCRSGCGAGLFAAVRSVIGTAARCGIGAYQVIS